MGGGRLNRKQMTNLIYNQLYKQILCVLVMIYQQMYICVLCHKQFAFATCVVPLNG